MEKTCDIRLSVKGVPGIEPGHILQCATPPGVFLKCFSHYVFPKLQCYCV